MVSPCLHTGAYRIGAGSLEVGANLSRLDPARSKTSRTCKSTQHSGSEGLCMFNLSRSPAEGLGNVLRVSQKLDVFGDCPLFSRTFQDLGPAYALCRD